MPSTFGQIDGLQWCTEMAQERRDSGTGDHYGVIRREDDRLVGCLWTKRTDWVGMVTEIVVRGRAATPAASGWRPRRSTRWRSR